MRKTLNKGIGRWAEDIAARFLKRKGYRILARNFTCRLGEIDIIASKDNEIVFVEVRYRREGSFILPEESITEAKKRRIRRTSWAYLRSQGLNEPFMRFDLMCVTKGKWFEPVKVTHIVDAF